MCRPKQVEQLRNTGIINSTTRLHLVGSFYENFPISIGSLSMSRCHLRCHFSDVRSAAAGRWPAEIMGSNPTGGHGYLSVVSVVCCQVEVSATSWSLVQRSPTDCGTSLCVIHKHQEWVLHIYIYIYIYDISRLRVKCVSSLISFIVWSYQQFSQLVG